MTEARKGDYSRWNLGDHRFRVIVRITPRRISVGRGSGWIGPSLFAELLGQLVLSGPLTPHRQQPMESAPGLDE
jgi:hypothetical protein